MVWCLEDLKCAMSSGVKVHCGELGEEPGEGRGEGGDCSGREEEEEEEINNHLHSDGATDECLG